MKKIRLAPCFICIFLLFLVPALTGQDTVETIVRENSVNTETASLNIRTNVNSVEVYINGLYEGVSPLSLANMTPGMYALQLRKDGWEKKSVFVQLDAQTETNLYFELTPITGFLRVYSNVSDAQVFIDGVLVETGSSSDSGLIELQEGLHTIEIKKFGYITESKSVAIFDRFFSEVSFDVKKAPFEIQLFSPNQMQFNPNAPGKLGQVKFNFSVTAPGSAVFEVFDKNGVAVITEYFYNLESAYHNATWDGRNSLGIALPEGVYSSRLEAIPSDGWQVAQTYNNVTDTNSAVSLASVVIDNSIFYPIVSIHASGTSVGVANARLMPVGTTVLSFNGATDFSLNSGLSAVPFSASAAFTPFPFTEFSIRVGAEAESQLGLEMPVIIGGGAKVSAKINNGYIGGILRYTYTTEPTYTKTYSESGLGFGIIGAIESGLLLFSFSEEVVFGSDTGRVNEFDGHLKTGVSAQFQKGIFSSSAWASVYSPFTFSGMELIGVVESGLEGSVLIPNTTVAPNIGCSYVYSKDNGHNIMLRFGLNVLLP